MTVQYYATGESQGFSKDLLGKVGNPHERDKIKPKRNWLRETAKIDVGFCPPRNGVM